jgi:hypothetical protein
MDGLLIDSLEDVPQQSTDCAGFIGCEAGGSANEGWKVALG